MSDDLEYDYEIPDQYNHDEEESYFYHTLGDFESYVKELGAKYVLGELDDEIRKQLEEAFKQC